MILMKSTQKFPEISLTFDIFHFDISGKYFILEQSINKLDIFIIWFVFHFDISGKDSNEEHPKIF